VTELDWIKSKLTLYGRAHSGFPIGDAGPTPDFPTCCRLHGAGGDVDNMCPTMPSIWKADKTWAAVGFSLESPTLYRFTYHSDGKTFVVQAIGDLDCNDQFATFELRGEMVGGEPKITLAKPAPGTY
jgi:hypothetical protein